MYQAQASVLFSRQAALLTLFCALAAFTFAAPAFAQDGAAPASSYNPESGYQVVQPYGKNVYKETPHGAKSEAWGDSKYGPHHLRRISPTEHLPAQPQVEKTIPATPAR